MKWQAIFLERGSCLGWTWCAGCWPISRLFSRIHGAIVSRERRSLGGGPDAPRCIARGERRGVGARFTVARSEGETRRKVEQKQKGAPRRLPEIAMAHTPLLLLFFVSERPKRCQYRSVPAQISGHEVRPCSWQPAITRPTRPPPRHRVLSLSTAIRSTVITDRLGRRDPFRYAICYSTGLAVNGEFPSTSSRGKLSADGVKTLLFVPRFSVRD